MDQVRDLQTALVARGHLEGEVDGLLGPATRAALARAEAEFGLIADGHPDAEAFAALGLTLASPPQA